MVSMADILKAGLTNLPGIPTLGMLRRVGNGKGLSAVHDGLTDIRLNREAVQAKRGSEDRVRI